MVIYVLTFGALIGGQPVSTSEAHLNLQDCKKAYVAHQAEIKDNGGFRSDLTHFNMECREFKLNEVKKS
jgi:hypothetical protein